MTAAAARQQAQSKSAKAHCPALLCGRSIAYLKPQAIKEQHELYFQEIQTFKLEHSPARSKYPAIEPLVPEGLLMITGGGGGGSMLQLRMYLHK